MFRKVAAIAVAACALLAIASPTRAGSLEWKDPEGDALPLTPDFTKVSLATTPDSFIWKSSFVALSDPGPYGTGHHFTLEFFFEDVEYIFRIIEDRVSGGGVQFQKADPTAPTVESIGCAKCKFDIDRKSNTVTLTASLGTLQAASRKLVAGAKIERILAFTGSTYSFPETDVVGGTFLYGGSAFGDSAPTPEGATFTI